MYHTLLTFCAFCALQTTCEEQSSLYLDEIRSLSELPMDKLIQIKSSLASENDVTGEEENKEENVDMSSRTFSLALPTALPLRQITQKPIRRYEDYYDDKGKDTKVSKIFQLAITALSFLAFGGYLLTLIITAIRRNTNGNGNGNVIVFSNLQSLQKLNRPKRNILVFDPRENNFETDRLYEGMIMLSRSYALYK
ncbi:PREDICTED: uncharacterized protein LOC106745732 [Dinoponera quadriceps]|uniref:Uncharacterized protein LOC106745732 n=1 Tax=Dinoponera quadriceps TaxID=609295 RepID=A0A6P3XF36_DINQU|nr:PREDICTED: uncharacterized protein LOC106745732 [Dinoponera quadriceps]